MRKFKHIPTGNIWEYYVNKGKEELQLEGSITAIPFSLTINSKDWEETKGYTILTFKIGYDKYPPSYWKLNEKTGMYHSTFQSFKLESFLQDKNPIYSVRREIDGEVFTVGDEFECQDCDNKYHWFKDKIHSFEIHHCGDLVVKISENHTHNLPFFSHIRKPKPKEWEIITVRLGETHNNYKDKLYTFSENGKENVTNQSELNDCTIHSVKRLRDNEIFSIGDVIADRYGRGKISGFEICNDTMNVNVGYMRFSITNLDVNKVKEDWQITSFRSVEYKNYFKRQDDGTFEANQFSGISQDVYLKDKRFEIGSVKRMSDGTEFKLGDTVKIGSRQGKITAFSYPKSIMNVVFEITEKSMASLLNPDLKKIY